MNASSELCPRTWAQRCRAWAERFGQGGALAPRSEGTGTEPDKPAAGDAATGLAGGISIAEIMALHGNHGSRPLLLMLLACLCLPPIMGLGTTMSLAIFAMAWQWQRPTRAAALPQRIARARLSPSWSRRTLHALAWLHEFSAARIRPRLSLLMHRASHGLWALWIAWMGIIIFIPLPLGNILPGLSLIALCLGWMHRDGLMLLLALAFGLSATVYASGVIGLALLALGHALETALPPPL